jgi:hypothetical protein
MHYHRRDGFPQYHRAAATMLQLACDHVGGPKAGRAAYDPTNNLPA